jgi:prepilin-type processing-associated H-X9-DG protein/prepilin-type N-terminal cleavage/methylation domain-containing protein
LLQEPADLVKFELSSRPIPSEFEAESAYLCGGTMRRRAFTLVELLVVIGIIALLISILMPTLSAARKASEATKCSAHLHGMAQAWQMYTNQYKMCVPGRLEKLQGAGGNYGLGDGGDEYRPRWYELLGAMVGQYANKNPKATEDDTWQITNDWFLCPSVPEYNNSRNYVYGYNHLFLGDARPKGGIANLGTKQWINYPVRAGQIRAASETVMIADSMGTAAAVAPTKRMGYYNNGIKDPDAACNKGYLIDVPRATANSGRADVELSGIYYSGPDPRHKKRANVAFCDGHVEGKTLEELGYVVSADGSINFTGAGATNKYFSGTAQDVDPPDAK